VDCTDDIPENVERKLVCFGFPLFRPKAGQDRSQALKSIPKEVKVLLVSGERDEFLNREYQTLPRGTAALVSLSKESKASFTISKTNGRHNPLDSVKNTEKDGVLSFLTSFLEP